MYVTQMCVFRAVGRQHCKLRPEKDLQHPKGLRHYDIEHTPLRSCHCSGNNPPMLLQDWPAIVESERD